MIVSAITLIGFNFDHLIIYQFIIDFVLIVKEQFWINNNIFNILY